MRPLHSMRRLYWKDVATSDQRPTSRRAISVRREAQWNLHGMLAIRVKRGWRRKKGKHPLLSPPFSRIFLFHFHSECHVSLRESQRVRGRVNFKPKSHIEKDCTSMYMCMYMYVYILRMWDKEKERERERERERDQFLFYNLYSEM